MDPPSSTTGFFLNVAVVSWAPAAEAINVPILSSCFQFGYFAHALNRHLMAARPSGAKAPVCGASISAWLKPYPPKTAAAWLKACPPETWLDFVGCCDRAKSDREGTASAVPGSPTEDSGALAP